MTNSRTVYHSQVRELLDCSVSCHQPISGSFELTSRCNLACRMCYVRQAAGDSFYKGKELSPAQWLLLAQQALDNGLLFLTLTGGEIFLRQDFFEIYEPLTRMGFILTLMTNGTLITDEIANRLVQSPPNHINITIYGASKETYQTVTGVADGFNNCCAGIETLIAHHLPIGLKTTITRQNVSDLTAMKEMARNWEIPLIASWLLAERRDGKKSDVENCRLSAKDGVKLEALDGDYLEDWEEARKLFAKNRGNFYCRAGKATFAITSFGEMNVCLNLPLPACMPLETGFRDAWDHLESFVDSAPPATSACKDCDARGYCQLCPSWSYFENGTLNNPVSYLCEIARERKKVRLPNS